MAYTLNGNDIGQCRQSENELSSNIDQITFPASTSDKTICMDYDGVKRIITLNGVKSFSSLSDYRSWFATIEAILNGNQIGVNYYSEKDDKIYKVFVASFKRIDTNEALLYVSYNLTLLEGA